MSLKAFDISSVVDKVSLANEKSKCLITCLDSSLKNLYLGTSDCFVVHYIVEKEVLANGKISYQASLQRHRQLGLKRGINQILTCPAASKLLVLCDGNIFMLSMTGLEMKAGATREIMRGATVMARNNRPCNFNPFSVECKRGENSIRAPAISESFPEAAGMKSSKHIESPALESFLISIFDSYMRRALNLCGWRRIDDPNVYFDELEEKTLRNQRRGCFDGSKFKNVLRHPTTVCVGTKRKAIQIWSVDHEKITVLKEISVNEVPNLLALDGQTICTTLGNQYFLVNYSSGRIQELFMFEAHNTKPIIKVVGKEEFLLSGPTNTMGMIVTADGLSQHQPLNWADGLTAIAHAYPYALVLGNSTITVHSMLDQRQKQAIAFQGGVVIGDFDNNVYVASQRAVYSLVPLSFDKQVQILLIEKRVEEAIELSNVANTLKPAEYNDKFLMNVQAQGGFVYFSQTNFVQAAELFYESRLALREVIILFPSLMPSNVIFQPSRPQLHNIKDVNQVVKNNKALLADAKTFLLDLLETCRGVPLVYSGQMTEIDTALLKLYAECNHDKLMEFVSKENSCYFDDSVVCLKQYKRFHALALFYRCSKEPEKAIDTWKRLVDGQDVDLNFPGLEYLVEYISSLENHDLVWKYASWLLEKDQALAAKIFTERPEDEVESEKLRPDAVADYLVKFPVAMRLYLEYLVFERNTKKERFHTHLAVMYLDDILKLMKERIPMPESLQASRKKLQDLLESSSLYRVAVILSKIGDLELHNEVAILYGKQGMHEKALQILVCKVHDDAAAERYCIVTSQGKDDAFRKELFHVLLSVYLNSGNRPENQDVKAAIQLLNSHQSNFDPIEVLKIIPESWSVGDLSSFLSGSLRNSLHSSRTKKVEAGLSRSVYLKNRGSYICCQNGAINVTEDRSCAACHKPFAEPVVARFPNGILTHVHCIDNMSICPVTGIDFLKRVIITR